MKINTKYGLVNIPANPTEVTAQMPDRSFKMHDVEGAENINDVLGQLNIGEYSQDNIDKVCKGYSLIKDDFGNPLSIVSSTYDLLQPIEAFAFLDTLQDELKFKYTSAGFTNGGRKLNITANCGDFEIAHSEKRRKGDIIGKRITASTSFDGTSATSIKVQLHRVWCSNGMANWIDDRKNQIIVRHTKNQRAIMATALEQVTGIKQVFETLYQDINRLKKTKINDEQANRILEDFFRIEDMSKVQSRVADKVHNIRTQFYNSARGAFGENAYDLLNAYTAWNTHIRSYKETSTNKMTRSLDENKFNTISNESGIKQFRKVIKNHVGV